MYLASLNDKSGHHTSGELIDKSFVGNRWPHIAKDWPYSLDAVAREASKLALIRALQATQGNC